MWVQIWDFLLLIKKSCLDEFLQEEFDVAELCLFDAQRGEGRHVPGLNANKDGPQVLQIRAHQTESRSKIANRLGFYYSKFKN